MKPIENSNHDELRDRTEGIHLADREIITLVQLETALETRELELFRLEARLVESLSIHFPTDDICPDVILSLQTETHLFQEELRLFFDIHCTDRFHGDILQNLGGFLDLPFGFLHLGEELGQARPLQFREHLAVRNSSQSHDQILPQPKKVAGKEGRIMSVPSINQEGGLFREEAN